MKTTAWTAIAAALFSLGLAQGAKADEVPATSSTEAIIKGFAKFQAGRVERLVLDQFLDDLAHQQFVVKFFPQTSTSVTQFNGTSGKRLIPLLQYYFHADLDTLQKFADCLAPRSAAGKLLLDKVNGKPMFDNIKNFLATVRDGSKSIDDFTQQCEMAKATGTPAVAAGTTATLAEQAVLQATDTALRGLVESLTAVKQTEPGASAATPLSGTEAVQILNEIQKDTDDSKNTEGKKDTKDPGVVDPSKADKAKSEKPPESPKAAAKKLAAGYLKKLTANNVDGLEAIKALQSLSVLLHADEQPAFTTDGKPTGAEKPPKAAIVKQLFVALDALGFSAEAPQEFAKFKDEGLFLASLRDAGETKDSEAVRQVIEDFVDDQSAFRERRAETGIWAVREDPAPNLFCSSNIWYLLYYCHDTYFVSSYYGMSATYADEAGNGNRRGALRAYGPVGFEWKVASFWGYPVSVGVAPVDLGAYVTNELRGKDYSATLDDIKAPSYYLSIGVKNHPFAVLAGYQEKVSMAAGRKIDIGFISVAFDLPLFTIW